MGLPHLYWFSHALGYLFSNVHAVHVLLSHSAKCARPRRAAKRALRRFRRQRSHAAKQKRSRRWPRRLKAMRSKKCAWLTWVEGFADAIYCYIWLWFATLYTYYTLFDYICVVYACLFIHLLTFETCIYYNCLHYTPHTDIDVFFITWEDCNMRNILMCWKKEV